MKILLIILMVLVNAVSVLADDTLQTEQQIENSNITDTTIAQSNSLYPMSSERADKLTSYSQFKNIWRFTNFFISIGILLLILFTGLSAKLRTFAEKIPNKFFALWAFVILFTVVDYLLSLPFHIYRGFLVEGEYGFINQTFFEWFSEDLLSFAIDSIFSIIPVYFLYMLIRKTKYWWLQFTIGAIPFMLVMIILYPIFISPLFNEFNEVENQEIKSEILTLAESVGIEDADIFQVNASKQSSKVNAYVTGIFGSKRIVLYDNLINNFSKDEILFVMGHEMGHYVKNHIWIGFGTSLIFIALALWLTSITIQRFIDKFKEKLKFESLSDWASLPLLLIYLSVIMFFFNPITNSLSRYHEHQSDIYGMQVTNVSGDDAATSFKKISAYNLSDPAPHPFLEFWFYSHPSLQSRIDFVKNYRK